MGTIVIMGNIGLNKGGGVDKIFLFLGVHVDGATSFDLNGMGL